MTMLFRRNSRSVRCVHLNPSASLAEIMRVMYALYNSAMSVGPCLYGLPTEPPRRTTSSITRHLTRHVRHQRQVERPEHIQDPAGEEAADRDRRKAVERNDLGGQPGRNRRHHHVRRGCFSLGRTFTLMSRGGSHKSTTQGGDKKEHVTVQYKKGNGDHVTTKHVYT